ncbi:MAG: hypothetical protein ACKPGI_14470, partial [Verrucomicrobiota bacterium]
VPVIMVPKPVDSCRIENRGFPAFLRTFSSEASARVSSFFRFSFQALCLVRSDPQLAGSEMSAFAPPAPHFPRVLLGWKRARTSWDPGPNDRGLI